MKINTNNIKVNVNQQKINKIVESNEIKGKIQELQQSIVYNSTIVDNYDEGYSSGYTIGLGVGFPSGFTSGYESGYTNGFDSGYTTEHIVSITLDFSSGETYTSFENIYSYGTWTFSGSTNINTIFYNLNRGGWINSTGFTTEIGDEIQIYFSAFDLNTGSSLDISINRDPLFIETPVKTSNVKYLDAWMIQMLESYNEINRNQLSTLEEKELFLEILQPNFRYTLRGSSFDTTNTIRIRYGHRTDADWIKVWIFDSQYPIKGNVFGFPSASSIITPNYLIKDLNENWLGFNNSSYALNILTSINDKSLSNNTKMMAMFHAPNTTPRPTAKLTRVGWNSYDGGTHSMVKHPVFDTYNMVSNRCHILPFELSGDTLYFNHRIDNAFAMGYQLLYKDGVAYKKAHFTKNILTAYASTTSTMTLAQTQLESVRFNDFRFIFQTTPTNYSFLNNHFDYDTLDHIISGVLDAVKNKVNKIRWFTSYGTDNTVMAFYFNDTEVEGYIDGTSTAPMILSDTLESVSSGQTRTYQMNFDFSGTSEYKMGIRIALNGSIISNEVVLQPGYNSITLTTISQTVTRGHYISIYPTTPSIASNFKITNFNLITPIALQNEIVANKTINLSTNGVAVSAYPDLISKMNEASSIYSTYGFTLTWTYS